VAVVAAGAIDLRAQGQARHGRLFPPWDLGLLEGPDRDLWQMPGQIMDALGIAEGSVVADLGAGGGWFTIRLARRVKSSGKVFAEDIQVPMLEAMKKRLAREGLRNVESVLGTSRDPHLPAAAIDAVLMVDTYYEVEDPVPLLRNLAKALKPQGRVGVVDFKKNGWGPGPPLEERVDQDVLVRNAEAAGLKLARRETFLPLSTFRPHPRPSVLAVTIRGPIVNLPSGFMTRRPVPSLLKRCGGLRASFVPPVGWSVNLGGKPAGAWYAPSVATRRPGRPARFWRRPEPRWPPGSKRHGT
jgi:SAM-dependent methyltransferase